RCSERVSMLAVPISISTFDRLGSFSLWMIVPFTSPKRPLTVEIMRCLTANSTSECAGSTLHVVTPVAVDVAAVVMFIPQVRVKNAALREHCLRTESDYTLVSYSCQVIT